VDFLNRDNKTFTTIAFVLLFACFAVVYSVPIGDIDLWWHLASGKYITDHRSLIETDPFCYTTSLHGITPGREIILNGYWASQVLFYASYSVFGNSGLIIIRVLLLLLILLTIYLIGRKIGASDWSIIIVLVLAGWMSSSYTGERPQLFSFLFATILLYMLDDLKKAYSEQPNRVSMKHFILLPGVMLLWANFHRGFIMGPALAVLFAVSEGAMFLLKKPGSGKSFCVICATIAVTIAVSFINPNFYTPYIEVMQFEGSVLQQRTSEYMSPITLLLSYRQIAAPYWLYLFLVLSVFLLSFRKIDKTHFIVVVFLSVLSLSAFRYIPFLVYTTAPWTALYLSRMIEGRVRGKVLYKIFAALLVGIVLIMTISGFQHSLGKTMKHQINGDRFPEEAASFILENSPSGNMFNHFSWGGYLIWRLYPHHKVFIDGRALNINIFADYTHILWNQSEAKRLLDYYGVDVVVIPGLNPFTGEFYGLAHLLQGEGQWHLIFADGTAMVFVRGAGNKDIISRFSLPKAEVSTHIIRLAEHMLASGMQTPHIWLALERAYREKGLMRQALEAHERSLGLRRSESPRR
jgi:hypothetical protein